MKILSVDDSPTIRFVVKKVVEEMGHEGLVAQNGAEALQIVSAEPIDVVLLDWNMPVMDGKEALREIKKKPICKNTKVIMCTVEGDKDEVEKIVKLGVDGYMLKPVTPEKLRAELMRAGVPDLRA
ncbi:MAG: response regulator [Leptospirales bacterium]|nr:response regulator [Leptospirales bacterium]